MILLFWLIGLIFVVLAIPLLRRKVGPNHLYGLRVDETLENESVWYEANARSAKDLIWVGVGTIVISSGLFLIPWRDPDHYVLVCCALLLVAVIGYAVKTRHRPVVSGAEEMVGAIGEALEDFQDRGRIRVHSESWIAQSDRPVRRGQRMRVVAIEGLTLQVEEVNDD